jgi:WD40 repeat protein/serine/threonine protein kinase
MTEHESRTAVHSGPPEASTASGGRLALRLACEQQYRWREGNRVPVEAYLDKHPDLHADVDGLMDLICNEWALREARGESIQLDEYLHRFPNLDQSLRMQWEVRDYCRAMTRPAVFSTHPSPIAPGSTPATDLPQVPGYELLSVLGRGGMGIVYKARHLGLNRIVALKMLVAGVLAKPVEQARFKIEAEAVARLQHPNIVQIFDVGEWRRNEGDAPVPYISLEFVDQGSLLARLADGLPAPRIAAELAETLARAMDHAHQRGIIHRDLKPGNILLEESEIRNPKSESAMGSDFGFRISNFIPKITDFGLAKRLDLEDGHTRTGEVMGTPSYMAPEQADGREKDISHAVDVYALGAILYEMLTGRPPFKGTSLLDTLDQVKLLDPPAPRRLQPGVPRDLETICLKCLAKEPHKRYASAAALADDLRRYLDGRPILARPTPLGERVWKAARRRPGVSILSAAVLCVSALGLAGILHQWRRAERNAVEHQQSAHALGVNLAQQVIERDDIKRALRILDSLKPRPGQKDLRGFEWDYLNNVCHGEKRLFAGQGTAAITRDGRTIAGGGDGGTVRLWDAEGREIAQMRGHSAKVTALTFSPDGDLLVSAAKDNLVKVWDWRVGREKFALPKEHSGWPLALAIVFDGTAVASGGADGRIIIRDLRNGTKRGDFLLPNETIRALAAPKDGKILAAATTADKVWLWDLTRPEADPEYIDHAEFGSVHDVAISPDGTLLASAAGKNAIQIWRTATREHLRELKEHTGTVARLSFSPVDSRLYSAGWDRTIRVWDLAGMPDRLPPPRMLRGHTSYVTALSADGDGKNLVSASADGTVRLWDPDAPGAESVQSSSGLQVHCMADSTDGRFLAVSGNDSVIRSFNVLDGSASHSLDCGAPVNALTFHPNSETIAAGLEDGSIEIRDTATKRVLHKLLGHGRDVSGLAYNLAGTRLASCSLDGSIRIWNTETGQETAVFKGCDGAVHAVAFFPDGKRLVSVGADRTVRIWDPARARELQTLLGHTAEVICVALDSGGQLIATGGKDREIIIWDAANGDRLFTLSGNDGTVNSLAFNPTDPRRLAGAGSEGRVRLWDLDTRQELLTLTGCFYETTCLLFRRDGRELVAGGGSPAHGQIKRWNAEPR